MTRALFLIGAAAIALSGCTLAPRYERPAMPVPATLPTGEAYAAQTAAPPARIDYADVVVDTRLRTLIEQALVNNRDLRIAVANITTSRAQYQVQRGALLPTVAVSGSGASRVGSTGTGTGIIAGGSDSSRAHTLTIGISAFELDFFGRVRSLNNAALERYLATEAGAQATRITLIGDLADAWSNYAADVTLLKVAEDTAANARKSVDLTQALLTNKVAPRTDLLQAQGVLADAESAIAQQKTAVAQDLNALQLLVGAPVDTALLPKSIEETEAAFAQIPAGTDSSVLLNRPDIIQAEHTLRAANANIGAARAALLPRITLTLLTGVTASTMEGLWRNGAGTESGTASLGLPIFQGGAGVGSLRVSKGQRDAALATYERTIQTAFRETADALARQGTLQDQMAAQRTSLDTAVQNDRLTEARYRGGVDTFLASLVAQRSLYTARRSMTAVELTSAVNRVAVFRAIGGGATTTAR